MQWGSTPIRVPEQPLLTLAEVSTAVGYSTKTVQRWVRDGVFPPPLKIAGGGFRWSNVAIGAWLLWLDYSPKFAAELKMAETDHPDEEPEAGKGRLGERKK